MLVLGTMLLKYILHVVGSEFIEVQFVARGVGLGLKYNIFEKYVKMYIASKNTSLVNFVLDCFMEKFGI